MLIPHKTNKPLPEEVRDIIEACWAEKPKSRPSAVKVAYILTNLVAATAERQSAPPSATASSGGNDDAQIPTATSHEGASLPAPPAHDGDGTVPPMMRPPGSAWD